MYEIIKQVVAGGGYRLADAQRRIKRLYALGDLTDAQLDELLSMAVSGASADAERPETLSMIQSLGARIDALTARMDALEGVGGAAGHPAWEPWDGVSDRYQYGAVVAHAGGLWQSVYQGQNVWEPGAVGAAFWIEYVEEA